VIGKLTITRGLSGSGKTTIAREMVDSRPTGEIVRLNRDDLRAMLLPSYYRQPEYRPEQIVTRIQHGPITALLTEGVDVIVDDTNLRLRTVRELAQLAERANAEWECMDTCLAVPLEECIRRDTGREKPVGEDLIRRQWRKYLSHGRTLEVPVLDAPVVGKPYTAPEGGQLAIIVDIDGTVAICGDRDIYDGSRAHLDTPNVPVVNAVFREWEDGYHIIFCSGRDEQFRNVTDKWIRDNIFPDIEFPCFDLFMRPAGDRRKDSVVKSELFDQYIRHTYDVERIYDDRASVCKMWRSLGLTVLQCDEGNF
jgi:predicted kinase